MKERIEQISLLAIAILSMLVSFLDFSGLLGAIPWLANRISTLTLLITGLIAAYLSIERRGKSDRIEHLVKESADRTIASLGGVEVKIFKDTQEMYEYWHRRIWEVKKGIDDLTWGHYNVFNTPAQKKAFRRYMDDISLICSKRNIRYREVMTFPNLERIKRAESMMGQSLYNYQLRYYDIPTQGMPPLMQFFLIDSEEVFFAFYRGPYLPSEGEIRMSVKHPQIVKLFQDYYDTIWHGARILKEAKETNAKDLEKIREKIIAEQSH